MATPKGSTSTEGERQFLSYLTGARYVHPAVSVWIIAQQSSEVPEGFTNYTMLQARVLLGSTVIFYWIEFLLRHYELATPKTKVFGTHVSSHKFVTDSRDIVFIIYQTTLLLVLLVRNRITEDTCCV